MSGGFDSLEVFDQLYSSPSLARLTEEQRQQEEHRQQQEQAAATAYVNRRCPDAELILQALGLVAYETQRTFACGCEQTVENTIPGGHPGGAVRCRLHTNGGRAQLTYPRNKAGQE